MESIKIFIGCDHRGFELKNKLLEKFKKHNYHVIDLGAFSYNLDDDYPDIAYKLALEVAKNENSKGILLCGSGVGVCITANKVKGIRACLGLSPEIIQKAREDDDINVLCLPADFIDENQAFYLIEIFLNTMFKKEEKHIRRLEKIKKIEEA